MLLRISFETLTKNRILNKEGVALRKIGDLHVGLPQTKLLLLLPKSKSKAAAAAAAAGGSGGKDDDGNEKVTNTIKKIKDYSEHRYSVRIQVEGYELSTEPIVVDDMDADGTLSFRSWEMNRDGRVRVSSRRILPSAGSARELILVFLLFFSLFVGTSSTSLGHYGSICTHNVHCRHNCTRFRRKNSWGSPHKFVAFD